MTYRQLTRLFAPFERLDAPSRGIEGNGLGLAVSKTLVEAMDGRLDVASTPGTGSVFSVLLLAAVSAEAVPVARTRAPALGHAA
jgi:signal transduction histidine kinase